MSDLLIQTLVRSLHNIFTSIWIGGMLFMILTFLPVIRTEIADKYIQGEVITEVLIRQSRWVYVGILILAGTGLLMTRLSGKKNGFLDFDNPYAIVLSIKHIFMIIISLIAVIRSTIFREVALSRNRTKKKISMALLIINSLLGIVIIILSSFNAVII